MVSVRYLNSGSWFVVTRTQNSAGFWSRILSACVEHARRSWDGPPNVFLLWSNLVLVIATYVGQVNADDCLIRFLSDPLTCQSLLFGVRTSRLRQELFAHSCNPLLGDVIVL